MANQGSVDGIVTARALRAGGSDATRLVGAGFQRAARGVYIPASADAGSPDVRIAVVAARLPEGFAVGGWAAARLHERASSADGLTVFDGHLLELDVAARVAQPVLVCADPERRLRPAPGVRLLRSALAPGDVVQVAGVHVTGPLRTAFDLARLWPRTSAVVALDRLRTLGLVSAADLAVLVRERTGWRGVRQAHRVIALSDDGAESPRETMVRLLWIEAGLPRPVCNPVLTAPDGRFLGRVDLLGEAVGLVGEYDGAAHADAARRHGDAVRQERLEDAGLVVVRANDPDIGTAAGRAAFQHRLRTAYERALRWSRPRRWHASLRR